MHEAQLHDENSFITLTYSPEHLPAGETLVKRHFWNFMKYLRKAIAPIRIRFYMCGEYGEQLGRPHYHALIFGYDFPDKILWKVSRGNPVYTSSMLSKIWDKGFCSIGGVTFQSAAYVARYIMKKINGQLASAHYDTIDKVTGEMTRKIPEYTNMSLKPGIASGWFEKFSMDVYPEDSVILNGKRYKTPRYYDRLLRRQDFGEEFLETIKAHRTSEAEKRAYDSTPERLLVREQVQLSKLERLTRKEIDET